MQPETRQIVNWGMYPSTRARVWEPGDEQNVLEVAQQMQRGIARGNGRCYGDSANADAVFSTLALDKLLAFNPDTGLLVAQAGVLLADVLEVFLPRGWFLPVTPGTKFITLGGAIAADVHGKNHHLEGTFYNHTEWLDLLLGDGSIRRCSRQENSELFEATFGAMGLTGVVIRAAFRLKPVESAWIRFESERATNLDAILDAFERSAHWTYSMAWIDCLAKGKQLGRSILMRGEHATAQEMQAARPGQNPLIVPAKLKLNIPFPFPGFVLNPLTIRAFNWQMYHRHPTGLRKRWLDYDSFFYPLDAIHHWNRMYGKRGFTQYQFVLPRASSREGLQDILTTIAQSGQGSFLAVLKLFGPGRGWLSFPQEGYTLALDFPLKPALFPLLNKLDERVAHYGGRLYLAKDVRMPRQMLESGYPELSKFKQLLTTLPTSATHWQSHQAQRLGLVV